MINRNLFSVSAVLFGALCLSACGDDDGGGAKADKPVDSPAVTTSANALGQQSSAFTSISTEAGTGESTISQVGNSVQLFANSHQSYKAQAAASSGLQAAEQGLSVIEQAQAAGEGTYSFDGSHLVASFQSDGGSAGGSYTIDYNVDMTIADRVISGDFSLAFAFNNGQYDIDYAYDATYDALTLDEAGCAVAGGFTVNYDIAISGGIFDMLPAEARAQVAAAYQGGVVAATFGPNCGDVAVTGN